ncbi:MAG: hypothetical protein DHS20C06_12930 [Hyphobacterium sp.]|nr:MAG: hypothetical protein DHS20C06_12930 [Hyphobacterium sp.]
MTDPFFLSAVIAVTIAMGLLIRWTIAVAGLKADAISEYQNRLSDRAHTVEGVNQAAFVRLYVDGHSPRWTLYAAAALIAAILITPIAIFGLQAFWVWITHQVNASDVFAPGYYPWMFYTFFGLVGAWAFCGFIAARFHHTRAPETFNAALMRARGEPLDDVEIHRAPPAWARKARIMAAGKPARKDD